MSGPKLRSRVIRSVIKDRGVADRSRAARGQVYQCILETSWLLKNNLARQKERGRFGRPCSIFPVILSSFRRSVHSPLGLSLSLRLCV